MKPHPLGRLTRRRVAIAWILAGLVAPSLLGAISSAHTGNGGGFAGTMQLQGERYDTPDVTCDPDASGQHTLVQSDGILHAFLPRSGCGINYAAVTFPSCYGEFQTYWARFSSTPGDTAFFIFQLRVYVDGTLAADTRNFRNDPSTDQWGGSGLTEYVALGGGGTHNVRIEYIIESGYNQLVNLHLDRLDFACLPECSDRADNDGDGWKDYPADPGCTGASDTTESPNPQCSDGVNNDGDGWKDYPADPGCTSIHDNSESPNPQCSDGVNNDGDAWTDYPNDPGCTSIHDNSESPNPQCSDGVNNDGDAWTDYPNDPGCTSARDDSESPNPGCSDGFDNDGDGWTDYPDDPGCTSLSDGTESPNPPQCSDGKDNDGDGWTDYPADPGCTSTTDNSESPNPTIPQCSDFSDNDNDGRTDWPSDPNCSSPLDPSEGA